MATTFFLVRHGAHALLDRVLVGCKVDVALDSTGRRQALALAERFANERINLVQASPRERARETARPIAERVGVTLEIEPAVDEIDCGAWSGRSFEELANEPSWREWNVARSTARPPSGESMRDAQQRIVGHLETMLKAHPGWRIVIVSHCDVIRAAILHYRRQSLGAYGEIAVAPAAVSTLVLDGRSGMLAQAGGSLVP